MVLEYYCKEYNPSKIIISNKIEELHKITHFIEQLGKQNNLPSELTMNLSLAIEEAVANIILYGFEEKKTSSTLSSQNKNAKSGEIEISFNIENNMLVFTIIDEGKKFDITLMENPDTALLAEERPVGGLGIFIIKQIMNEIEYRRENGKNILTMSKKILT